MSSTSTVTATNGVSTPALLSPKKHSSADFRSPKIQDQHLERLAIVYVRQSSPYQVLNHRESRERQYALANFARDLGWPTERVLIIDEDQGQSGKFSEDRSGFQRLLAEVTMDHVGLVLGLELNRLSRSSKDWHHLLELCGIFGTLLADQDGTYDASDPNDRLLLGLRGTISEVELHTMRNRLTRGMLNKAERGELFLHVPVGYVKTPTGGIAMEPDEQARSVIHLLFDKFDELGSGHALCRYLRRHDIRIGIRPIEGPNRGQLEWRRPSQSMIFSILKHPLYAGTYAFGRFPLGRKRGQVHKRVRQFVGMDRWKVVRHDCVPAYITWDRYLANLRRLKENRSRKEAKGAPRQGLALLGGLAICGRCGRRLNVSYDQKIHPRYDCIAYLQKSLEKTCRGVKALCIDALVTQQVLRVLEPAGIDLCLQAVENIQRERDRLTTHWKQRLERAQYEAYQTERCYRAVDPENRLVARTLEQQWEERLRQHRQTQEEYARFQRETPLRLSAAEQEQIRSLASDIPALWHSPNTSAVDRKEIVRLFIDRVVVHVRDDTEHVDVTIHWAGGYVSQHAVLRPVSRYIQLEDYEEIMDRLREGRKAGRTAAQIAEQLNREGFRPPAERAKGFNKNIVNQLFSRLGHRRSLLKQRKLPPHDWWLMDLADELHMHPSPLRHWRKRGYMHCRREPGSKFWIIWADPDELRRLQQLRDYLKTEHHIPYPAALTRPKSRPSDDAVDKSRTPK